ncbi:MAG: hypothetical protein ACI4SF_13795, partial [Oscillospiraceae bacterium]
TLGASLLAFYPRGKFTLGRKNEAQFTKSVQQVFARQNLFSFPIFEVNCAFLAILFCPVSAVPFAMV